MSLEEVIRILVSKDGQGKPATFRQRLATTQFLRSITSIAEGRNRSLIDHVVVIFNCLMLNTSGPKRVERVTSIPVALLAGDLE